MQRKLVQQEQEKMDLQREMELEQLNGELLSEALVEKQQRLQVDSQLFEMMSKATTNIESLCDKAGIHYVACLLIMYIFDIQMIGF